MDSDLFAQWRSADREATLVEKAVLRSALQAFSTGQPFPPIEEFEKAQRLRVVADRLFEPAMLAMTGKVYTPKH